MEEEIEAKKTQALIAITLGVAVLFICFSALMVMAV